MSAAAITLTERQKDDLYVLSNTPLIAGIHVTFALDEQQQVDTRILAGEWTPQRCQCTEGRPGSSGFFPRPNLTTATTTRAEMDQRSTDAKEGVSSWLRITR